MYSSEKFENEVLAPHLKPPLARLGRKLTVAGGPGRSAHERRSTVWAQPRLYEREAILEEMAAMFSGNWERPNGAVIIEGASWTGRTALLGAARRLAVESGLTVFHARGNDLERGTAWGVVRQLLTPQSPWQVVKAHGRNEAPDASSVDEPLGDGASTSGQLAAHFRHFEELLRRLSSARPVLVAVDDVHLADPESCRWMFYLARRLGHRRVHLVLTSDLPRRGALTAVDRIRAEPSARVMTIQPLSQSTVAKMIGSALNFREPCSEDLVDAVYGASGGSPLLVVAILRELSATGIAGGGPPYEVVEGLAPVQVGKALLARVAALPADGTSLLALLQAVAVLGAEADLRGCAQLAGIDPTLAAMLVDCLVDDGLLSTGGSLRCQQGAVEAATLQEMGFAGRARMHLAAARLLEERERPAEVVANHLLLGEHCVDQWAARRLEEAGRQALARGDRDTALSFLEKALSEYPRTASASLHIDMARATAPGDIAAADRHLSRAVALGADLREVADAALVLAGGAPEGEALPALVTTLRKTAARLPGAERDLRVRLEVAAAELAGSSAGTAQAREIIEPLMGQSQPAATSAQRLGLAFLALVDSGSARRRSAAEVTELLSRALSPRELISGDPWEVRFRARALLALARAGSFGQAEKLASAALQQARNGSGSAAATEYSVARAGALLLEGRLAQAEAEASGALSGMEGRPWVTRPLALACLAEALICQARATEALDVLTEAPSGPLANGTAQENRYLIEQRGHVLLRLGRTDDAWQEFQVAKLQAENDGIDNPAATTWRSGVAACLKAQGMADEARLLAEENLALARAFGAPWLIGKALIEVAACAPRPERLSFLGDAVVLCEASGAQLLLATALVELGTELGRDSERRREAVEVLHRGARLALTCGAAGLVEQAASALRAAGARPRRFGLTGREALTPAEERVAIVACAGHTNAEIASRLFLSGKTVEGHLAHVYRKLGVRSRQEMAEQLREHALS